MLYFQFQANAPLLYLVKLLNKLLHKKSCVFNQVTNGDSNSLSLLREL